MWLYWLSNLRMGGGGTLTLTLREAVVAWLNGLTALVTLVGTRIYFADPSQLSLYPCIVVQVTERSYGHNLDGADGVSIASVHIEAISQFESVSIACVETWRNYLDGFRGVQSGVDIGRCLLDDEFDAQTPPLAGSDMWIYHATTEYGIWHRVPPPSAPQSNIVGPSGSTTLRQAVVGWLNTLTPLTALVGPRIYYADPSQLSSYPCVVVSVSNRPYGHNLDGSDATSIAVVNIEAISQFESESVACVEAWRDAIDGFRGIQSGVRIGRCLLENEEDMTTPPLAGSDLWIYRVATRYKVWHRVPAVTNVTQVNI